MPEQGFPTKNQIEGSVQDAARGIFDLINDAALEDRGIEGGNEDLVGKPAGEPEADDGTTSDDDDFDAEAAAALQGEDDESDEPEDDEAEEDDESDEDEEPEDDAGEEDSTSDETDPLVTVKVDGEERQVPLSEALRGYSSTQSFTRKSQALAESRREFEAEVEAVQQERNRLDTTLAQAEELLKAHLPQEPAPDNPQAWIRYQQEIGKLRAVQAERAALAQKAEAENAKLHAARVEAEAAKLIERFPEWEDPKVASEVKSTLAKYAVEVMGYEEDDVMSVSDARTVELLWKAQEYDRLMERTKETKVKAKQSKTLRPGTPSRKSSSAKKMSKRRNAKREALRESGSVRDAAALFEDMLDD